jgi:hypothetical protein
MRLLSFAALALLALLASSGVQAALSPSEQLFVDTTSAEGARAHLQYYTNIDRKRRHKQER